MVKHPELSVYPKSHVLFVRNLNRVRHETEVVTGKKSDQLFRDIPPNALAIIDIFSHIIVLSRSALQNSSRLRIWQGPA